MRAKRLGWDEKTSVTEDDILDPYDYESDDLEGELETRRASGPFIKAYTQHLVGGQLADPKTIRPVGN